MSRSLEEVVSLELGRRDWTMLVLQQRIAVLEEENAALKARLPTEALSTTTTSSFPARVPQAS